MKVKAFKLPKYQWKASEKSRSLADSGPVCKDPHDPTLFARKDRAYFMFG